MSVYSKQPQSAADGAPRVRKILSLDGGGVRGLSSIMILKHIMKSLGRARKPPVEPWQEFDMIAGTSTGGLIAIMLGRLKMPLEMVEDQYLEMSKDIFQPRRNPYDPRRMTDFVNADGKFDSNILESKIKQIVKKELKDESALLQEPEIASSGSGSSVNCKVFVSVVRAGNTSPTVLRSYECEADDPFYSSCKIWEAARATSAASTFFEPIQLGKYGQKFVDGGLKNNNPVELADIESGKLWPNDTRFIISIGTGSAPGKSLEGNLKNLAERLKDIVLDSENRSDIFIESHAKMVEEHRLFRFNVYHGLGDIGLEEYKAVPQIAEATQTYINKPEVSRQVVSCVKSLRDLPIALQNGKVEGVDSVQPRNCFILLCAICLRGQPAPCKVVFCRVCENFMCSRCELTHEPEHRVHFFTTQFVQWRQSMETLRPTSACSECGIHVRCRVECSNCQTALCFDCNSVPPIRNKWFERHILQNSTHKDLTLIMPPNFSCPSFVPRDCHCVLEVRGAPQITSQRSIAVLHCSRCLKVLNIGDRFQICLTCKEEYGAAIGMCKECKTQESHKHCDHKFQTVTLVQNSTASLEKSSVMKAFELAWQCQDCKSNIPSLQLSRHNCANLSFVATVPLLDELRFQHAGGKCPRISKPLHSSPTNWKCASERCSKMLMCDEWNIVCLTCPIIYCRRCILGPRDKHMHRLNLCMIREIGSVGVQDRQRRCRCCYNSYSREVAAGIECTTCRDWFWCLSCLTDKKEERPAHLFCHERLSVFQLLYLRTPEPSGSGRIKAFVFDVAAEGVKSFAAAVFDRLLGENSDSDSE